MPAEVKALSLRSLIAAIRQVATPDEYANMLAALSVEARSFVDKPAPAASWVPIALEVELADVAFSVACSGDSRRFWIASADCATRDFSGTYRIFLKLLSPLFLIKRVGLIWAILYRDNGQASVQRLDEEKRVVYFRISGVAMSSPAWWEYVLAGIEAVVRLTRIHTATLERVAGGGTENFLEFSYRW